MKKNEVSNIKYRNIKKVKIKYLKFWLSQKVEIYLSPKTLKFKVSIL